MSQTASSSSLPVLNHTSVLWSKRTVSVTLPANFPLRYLGSRRTDSPYGYPHAKIPVEEVVNATKLKVESDPSLLQNIPNVYLDISASGVEIQGLLGPETPISFPLYSIGYGMQDSIHNRIFAIIVCQNSAFYCHVFLCPNGKTALAVTEALAGAFQLLSLATQAKDSKDASRNTQLS